MDLYGFMWSVWTYVALYGSLWLQMALYGSDYNIWLNTAPNGSYGPKTSQDGQYGSIWLFMAHIWLHVATYGFKWLSVAGFATYGSRLPQMAHEGYMASDCFVWLLIALMATCGSRLLQMAQGGTLWL